MERSTIDRPGRIIFLGGIACVLVSTGLGLYLARRIPDHIEQPDWHSPDYDSARAEIARITSSLADVHALMWLTFALGTILTLVGLRILTRPPLGQDSILPLGSIREVFKNPE